MWLRWAERRNSASQVVARLLSLLGERVYNEDQGRGKPLAGVEGGEGTSEG